MTVPGIAMNACRRSVCARSGTERPEMPNPNAAAPTTAARNAPTIPPQKRSGRKTVKCHRAMPIITHTSRLMPYLPGPAPPSSPPVLLAPAVARLALAAGGARLARGLTRAVAVAEGDAVRAVFAAALLHAALVRRRLSARLGHAARSGRRLLGRRLGLARRILGAP